MYQNVKVAVKNQYIGQSLEDIEQVLKEDMSVRLVRDGLNVRLLMSRVPTYSHRDMSTRLGNYLSNIQNLGISRGKKTFSSNRAPRNH